MCCNQNDRPKQAIEEGLANPLRYFANLLTAALSFTGMGGESYEQ